MLATVCNTSRAVVGSAPQPVARMRFTGLLRAIAARTSHPDVYDTGFDELSLDGEAADVDSIEVRLDSTWNEPVGWTMTLSVSTACTQDNITQLTPTSA